MTEKTPEEKVQIHTIKFFVMLVLYSCFLGGVALYFEDAKIIAAVVIATIFGNHLTAIALSTQREMKNVQSTPSNMETTEQHLKNSRR